MPQKHPHTNELDKEQTRQKIINLIQETKTLIPDSLVSDLGPIDGFPDVPKWHKFEYDVWQNGELIRQLFKMHKALSVDKNILEDILSICLNRNAKRGRQSFIMLLWNKNGSQFADKLVNQLDDKSVDGHIIEGLNKMSAAGYASLIRPFCFNRTTWIRKQAIKYVEQYDKQ